jgi:hypothetical protein
MTSDRTFDKQSLIGAGFTKCDMPGATFSDVDISESQFTDVNFQRAHIRDADLSGVVIADAKSPGMIFNNCAMTRAQFSDVDLSETQFTNVNLQRAHIRDANLTGVVIEDAKIAGMTIAGHDVAALIAAGKAGLPDGLAAEAPRAFLPARDFAASAAFYETLGLRKLRDGDVAIFSTGPGAFILTRRYDPVWAENCMMQLMVDDLDAWWTHIVALDLPGRFGVAPPRPPEMQPWGLRVAYFFDPAGIAWHVAQRRVGVAAD